MAAVVGAGMTEFGERSVPLRGLLVEAATACLADAAVDPGAVEDLLVARSSGDYEGTTGLAGALAADLGTTGHGGADGSGVHARAVDGTSAAGGAGIAAATRAVGAGSDLVLVAGAERLTHGSTAATTDGVAAITHPVEHRHGVTLPAFAGLAARRYLDRHDVPREALAHVAVKNHRHGLDNPKAHFRREVTVEAVLGAPTVADPLGLYDFCPISDGGAAVLIASDDRARELAADPATDAEPVALPGVAGATGTHVVHEREDLTTLPAASEAARRAFDRADRSPADVDVAELHDMFTILEPLQTEALGLADPGTAWRDARDGRTAREGALPVNVSGGLKAKGHPIGASGLAQAVELYRQLTDDAGPRQVEPVPELGVACNVGGFGNAVVVSLFERR